MKYIFLLFFLMGSLAFTNVMAQDPYVKKTAEQNYQQQNYPEAIRLYESLLIKENADTASLRKLAICYLKTKQIFKAEQVLFNLINQTVPTEEVLMHYGSCLCMNNKYSQAKDVFQRVLSLNPKNSAAAKQLQDIGHLNDFFKDSSSVKLFNLSINSSHPEFSPLLYQNKLLFVSSRINTGLKRVYEYNNTPFLDIYGIDTLKIKKDKLNNNPHLLPGENTILFYSQKKLHESLTRETSNDNATPGSYHPAITSDTVIKNDKANGIALFHKDLQTSYHEGPSVYSPTENIFYFTSNRIHSPQNKNQLHTIHIYSTHIDSNNNFTDPKLTPEIPSEYNSAHPAVSADGNTLIFSSNMPGGRGGMDLYISKKENNKWSTPTNLTAVNTIGDEAFPFIDEQQQLFFASNGHGGLGGMDIYYCPLGTYSPILNPGFPINSSRDDFGVLIRTGNKSGYISSNRRGNGDDDNIYYFESVNPFIYIPEKTKEEEPVITFSGNLQEKESKRPIQTMVAVFQNQQANLTEIAYSDSLGNFTLKLALSSKYLIKIADAQYYILEDTFTTSKNTQSIVKSYLLEKNAAVTNSDSIKETWKPYVSKVMLNGVVVDNTTQGPLEAIVKITSLSDSNNTSVTITDFDGAFSSPVSYSGTYIVDILSEGYKLSTSVVELVSGSNTLKFQLQKIKNDYDSLQAIWKQKNFRGTLQGLIMAAPSNDPLADIAMIIPEGDTLLEDYTISDFEGKFNLKIRKSQPYNLIIQDDERGDISRKILLQENDTLLSETIIFPERKQKVVLNLDSIAKAYAEQDAQYNTTYKALVLDKDSKEPVDALIAIQSNPEGDPDEVTASDFNGEFSFKIRKHKTYHLSFVSKEYDTYKMLINSDNLLPEKVFMEKIKDARSTDSIIAVYKKKLKEKATLIGNVTTQEDNEPLMAFVAVYKNEESNPMDVHPSDENGNFSFALKKGELYKVEIMELGYLPVEEYLNTSDTSEIFRMNIKLKKPIEKKVFDSIHHDWKEQTIALEERKKQEDSIIQAKTIKGYVYEAETYLPIIARMVVVNDRTGKVIVDTMSNKEGKYSFKLKADEHYTIHLDANGYRTDSVKLYVAPDTKKGLSVIFLSKQPLTGYATLKQEPIRLEGFLTENHSGKKIQTVIGIFAETEENLVDLIHSNETGYYSTLVFPETNYLIKIADSRYTLLTDSIHTRTTNIRRNYELFSNTVTNNIDSLHQAWKKHNPMIQLRVEVRDDRTRRRLEAKIKLTSLIKEEDRHHETAHPNGSTSIDIRKEGSYRLDVLCEGYHPHSETIKIENGVTQKEICLRKIHMEYDSIQALWIKKIKGKLTGKITVKPNEALSDFVIAFEEGDTILQNYTISDFDGLYVLPLKKETPYTVVVQDSELGDQIAKVKIPQHDSVALQNFEFERSALHQHIDFDSLARYYFHQNEEYNTHFKCSVADSKTHEPIEALVAIHSQEDTIPDEVTATNEQGTFSLLTRKHRSYTVTIVSENYESITVTVNSDSYFPESLMLNRLRRSSEVDSMITIMEKEIRKKRSFQGTIVDAQNNDPIMGFVALFETGETPTAVHPADFDGNFNFQLDRQKNYVIKVIESGYLPYLHKISADDTAAAVTVVIKLNKPTPSETYDSIQQKWKIMEANLSTTIYGSIYEKNTHKPVSTDLYLLHPANQNELAHSYSNYKGQYKITSQTQESFQVKIGSTNSNVFRVNNPEKSRIIYKNFALEPEAALALTKNTGNKKKTSQTSSLTTSTNSTKSYFPIYYIAYKPNSTVPSYEKLSHLHSILTKNPKVEVLISGHADSSGKDSFNLVLSQQRAEVIKSYLLKKNVAPNRIKTEGLGATSPVISNSSLTGRNINRRAEFTLSNYPLDSTLVLYPTSLNAHYSLVEDRWDSHYLRDQIKIMLQNTPSLALHFEIRIPDERFQERVFNALQKELGDTIPFTYATLTGISQNKATIELFIKKKH